MDIREAGMAAIKKWGESKQMDMAIEECSELIKTIVKFRRYDSNPVWRRKMVEEMADVLIMIEQLKQLHSDDEEFKDVIEYKIKNIEKILADDDPERGLGRR